ncbi:hypothetical protein D9M69_701660 [compost metagenome]
MAFSAPCNWYSRLAIAACSFTSWSYPRLASLISLRYLARLAGITACDTEAVSGKLNSPKCTPVFACNLSSSIANKRFTPSSLKRLAMVPIIGRSASVAVHNP